MKHKLQLEFSLKNNVRSVSMSETSPLDNVESAIRASVTSNFLFDDGDECYKSSSYKYSPSFLDLMKPAFLS